MFPESLKKLQGVSFLFIFFALSAGAKKIDFVRALSGQEAFPHSEHG